MRRGRWPVRQLGRSFVIAGRSTILLTCNRLCSLSLSISSPAVRARIVIAGLPFGSASKLAFSAISTMPRHARVEAIDLENEWIGA